MWTLIFLGLSRENLPAQTPVFQIEVKGKPERSYTDINSEHVGQHFWIVAEPTGNSPASRDQ